jgi:PAS domain S-box-containing protein
MVRPENSAQTSVEKLVLYVRSEPDATPLDGVFGREAGSIEVTTETDPQTALSRLETVDVDCLVSGYDLPGTDGIEFLKAVRESHPDLPFILFTGAGDEATASRAISAGVTDYVRADAESGGVESLAARVRAVLAGAGAGPDGRGDRARIEHFADAFPDGAFVVDERATVLDVVAAGDDPPFRTTPETAVGERFDDVLPEATAELLRDRLREALERDDERRIEYRVDGQSEGRWFEARVGPLWTGVDGRTAYLLTRDVTERKRREHEYEQIFDSVRDAIAVFDPTTGEIVDVNEAYREMVGYDLKTIRELGIDGLSANDEGYTGERGWELIREVARTGESETVEWRAETEADDRLWLEATLAPAEIGGELRVLSIQRDITERRELERTYRDVFESVSDGLVIHDPDTGAILEVNDRYCEVTGYDREELTGASLDLIMPDDPTYTHEQALRRVQKTHEEDEQLFEFKGERKDGDTFVGEINLSTIEIRGRERVLASVRDITERKRREHEYEQIFDGVNDAIAVFDPETGEITNVNERYHELLGYDSLDRIRELGIEGLSVTEDGYTGERGKELVRHVARSEEPETVEWRAERRDGERVWLEVTLATAEIGGQRRVLSIQRDVTERKRRERAIEALEGATDRLQAAATPEEVATIAVETASDVLDLPNAICWFHDEDDDRLVPAAATDVVRDADLVSALSADRYEYDVFRDRTTTQYAPREYSPDNPLGTGVLLPLAEHGLLAAGARDDGRIDEAVLDISKALADHVTMALTRVERAQAVRKSERRFRLIAERIDEVIYLANTDFTEVLYVNPAYETVWGRSTDELYEDARKFIEAIDARDREATVAEIEAMIEELQRGDHADSYEFEYRIRQPGGEVRWVSATGYAVEMYGDERRFVGIVKDITERKRREQRLEVFNRILRHNLRNQLDVIRSHAETLAGRTDDDDHAERIVTAVDELASIGARARRTDQIMSMDESTTDVSLETLLEEVVAVTGSEERAAEITTDLPASADLRTNRDALYTVVRSALENATEHADSQVCITVEETEQGYSIVVDDDGPGIPEERLSPIDAGTETSLDHGRGLGLWQLRWGVDKLNGELSFETDSGTTVRITVPDHAELEREG